MMADRPDGRVPYIPDRQVRGQEVRVNGQEVRGRVMGLGILGYGHVMDYDSSLAIAIFFLLQGYLDMCSLLDDLVAL